MVKPRKSQKIMEGRYLGTRTKLPGLNVNRSSTVDKILLTADTSPLLQSHMVFFYLYHREAVNYIMAKKQIQIMK